MNLYKQVFWDRSDATVYRSAPSEYFNLKAFVNAELVWNI